MNINSCLFTGGGGAGNEAIYHLLKNKYNLHFADADRRAIDVSIGEKSRHNIPFASDQNFVDKLIKLCKLNSIDLLIPGVDEELLQMQLIRAQNSNIKIMMPDHAYSEIMLDKLDSVLHLESLGIQVPRTVLLEDAETVGFPCIAKPRKGRGSHGVFILNTIKDVAAYVQLTGISADQAVAQELLVGKEYTVTMVANNVNELRAVIPVYVEQKKGITIRALVDHNQDVIDACTKIHHAAPTQATYNIQLILSDSGFVRPFEINPRISTTFCLVVAAGIDPIAVFLGENDFGTIKLGQQLQRYWKNEFSV